MSDYPEHDKQREILPQSQAIGQFLEWLGYKGYHIARYAANGRLCPADVGIEEMLATYFEIDLTKLNAEKQMMLELIPKYTHEIEQQSLK